MTQTAWPGIDRRGAPRRCAAFAFYIRRTNDAEPTGAWMLNTSAGGAAFLVPVKHAPQVGERIELAEMHCTNLFVRDGATPLPPAAKVLRVDASDGETCRVAVRFVADDGARLGHRRAKRVGIGLQQDSRFRPDPFSRALDVHEMSLTTAGV